MIPLPSRAVHRPALVARVLLAAMMIWCASVRGAESPATEGVLILDIEGKAEVLRPAKPNSIRPVRRRRYGAPNSSWKWMTTAAQLSLSWMAKSP